MALMMALVGAAIAVILLAGVSAPGYGYEPLLLCPAVVWVAVIAWCLWLAGSQFRELRTVKDRVLVVTSEGFVACWGATTQDTLAVAFADLARVSLTVLPARYDTNFYLRLLYKEDVPPRWVDWRIPAQFRARDVIAQTIIEAQMRFKLEHANQS
jgi:hypothetical protein